MLKRLQTNMVGIRCLQSKQLVYSEYGDPNVHLADSPPNGHVISISYCMSNMLMITYLPIVIYILVFHLRSSVIVVMLSKVLLNTLYIIILCIKTINIEYRSSKHLFLATIVIAIINIKINSYCKRKSYQIFLAKILNFLNYPISMADVILSYDYLLTSDRKRNVASDLITRNDPVRSFVLYIKSYAWYICNFFKFATIYHLNPLRTVYCNAETALAARGKLISADLWYYIDVLSHKYLTVVNKYSYIFPPLFINILDLDCFKKVVKFEG
uniref:G_PROTEIN_RECEP_F1_2 domain-containing protein n=1 Tax=Heterorhabditis bacteriophora TaxID=37862 RepID=A0A1I7X5A1_HETBA